MKNKQKNPKASSDKKLNLTTKHWTIISVYIMAITLVLGIIGVYIAYKQLHKETPAIDPKTAAIIEKLLDKVPTTLDTKAPPAISKEDMEELKRLISQLSSQNKLIDNTSVLLKLGSLEFAQGNLEEAMNYENEAFKNAKYNNDLKTIAICLGNIGVIYIEKSDLDKALEKLKIALDIDKQIGFKQGETAALKSIGSIYYDKGELDQALQYYNGALKINREIGDKLGEADALALIGVIYRDKRELNKALENFQKSLNISREIEYKQGEAYALGCIGVVYGDKGELEQALQYHNDALKINHEMGDNLDEANDLLNIGLILKSKGEREKALENLKAAFEIIEKHGSSHNWDIIKKAVKEAISKLKTK